MPGYIRVYQDPQTFVYNRFRRAALEGVDTLVLEGPTTSDVTLKLHTKDEVVEEGLPKKVKPHVCDVVRHLARIPHQNGEGSFTGGPTYHVESEYTKNSVKIKIEIEKIYLTL